MTADVFSPSRFREVVWPREHGSWSLALEPLALGLIAFPSRAGALFALAAAVGFLLRRPLQVLTRDNADAARGEVALHALAGGGLLALTFAALAATDGGFTPLRPLAFAVLPAALFVHFDRLGENRALAAELAGVTAFAFLPAVVARLGGASLPAAFVLAGLAAARSWPTVLTLRAFLRGRKHHDVSPLPARLVALLALAVAAALAFTGYAPWLAAIAGLVLAARTFWLLSPAAPAWRASRLGMIEAVLGVAYVAVVGLACAA